MSIMDINTLLIAGVVAVVAIVGFRVIQDRVRKVKFSNMPELKADPEAIKRFQSEVIEAYGKLPETPEEVIEAFHALGWKLDIDIDKLLSDIKK
jgi:hypothetical protein